MPFFKERKRQEAMAALEAAGNSLWTEQFSESARTRIWHAFEGAFTLPDVNFGLGDPWVQICGVLRSKIMVDQGLNHLTGEYDVTADVRKFLFTHDDDDVATVVEAMWATLVDVANQQLNYINENRRFPDAINAALYRERLAYEFINGQMVPRSAEELHVEVVAPALRLLAGRPGWAGVETAYRKAIKEIADGEADDAITDAGTALQEALVLLGCQGNALGPLIASAKAAGILAPHDQTLADGIAKIMHWVSADRSEMGDGHQGASGATRPDAWFAVHVVGALILRLAEGPRVTG